MSNQTEPFSLDISKTQDTLEKLEKILDETGKEIWKIGGIKDPNSLNRAYMYIEAYKDPNQSQLFRYYYIHMGFFGKSDSMHPLSYITCYSEGHGSLPENIECINRINSDRFKVSISHLKNIIEELLNKLYLKKHEVTENKEEILPIYIHISMYFNTPSINPKIKIKSYKKNDILYDSGKSLIDIITSD